MLKNSQSKTESSPVVYPTWASLLLASSLLISGCSFFSQPEELNTEILEPIKVPGKVSAAKFEELMVIPQQPANSLPSLSSKPVPRPKPLNEEPSVDASSQADLPPGAGVLRSAEIAKDGNGSPVLRMDVGFGYAWPMVKDALQKTPLNLVDFNRSLATFYIEVVNPDLQSSGADSADSGFFRRLFSSDEDNSTLPLQVKVNSAHSGVYLSVQKDSESLASDEMSQKILGMIRGELNISG